ncbi:MAG: hypothetical protein JRE20_10145 [Deltaproteobacteria bacterium]|nr:hypothetical protein [Deltaproteobacteria bacterium]
MVATRLATCYGLKPENRTGRLLLGRSGATSGLFVLVGYSNIGHNTKLGKARSSVPG